jgi:hypothetical protein
VVVLADNDVVFKLAALNLLDKLPEITEVDLASIYVLDSVGICARKNPRIEQNFGTDAVERTLDLVEDLPKLREEDVPDATFDRLIDQEGIDVGEAILFAAATQFNPVRVVTGDKNSLCALHSSDCGEVIGEMSRCVICFEQLILRSIVVFDYTVVCERVASAPSIDRVLNDIAFTDGVDTPQERVQAALQSKRDSLFGETGTLLIEG